MDGKPVPPAPSADDPKLRLTPKGAVPVNAAAKSIPRDKIEKTAPLDVLLKTDTKDGTVRLTADVMERIYLEFKNRLLDDLQTDPIFLELLAHRPEIVVEIAPRKITLDGSTLKGRLARLIADGWFSEPRKVGTCRTELARTGNDPGGGGTLGNYLADFVVDGFLVRSGDAFIVAPAVKISTKLLEAV